MTNLAIGILSAVLSTNQPATPTNFIAGTNGLTVSATNTEAELDKIMTDDDAAHAEVDGWIRENQEFAAKGAPIPAEELNRRILNRLQSVRVAYEDFIKRYPDIADARLAYASFLDGIGEEEAQREHLEKAYRLEPNNPSVLNQFANYCGHNGELTNAFAYYTRASEIDPAEPIYYWNFATTIYLYRVDAMKFYHITESEVFDRSLALYAQALKHDPTNFVFATDLANSYYGIRPFGTNTTPAYRTNDALVAWTNALKLATTEVEREGVYIHQGRVKTYIGRYAEARGHLNAVTNDFYKDLKVRLLRNLDKYQNEEKTNALAFVATNLVRTLPSAPTGNTNTTLP